MIYLMYPRTEILFPHRSISALKGLRGDLWQVLVDRVAVLPETHEDSLAFSLMMTSCAIACTVTLVATKPRWAVQSVPGEPSALSKAQTKS